MSFLHNQIWRLLSHWDKLLNKQKFKNNKIHADNEAMNDRKQRLFLWLNKFLMLLFFIYDCEHYNSCTEVTVLCLHFASVNVAYVLGSRPRPAASNSPSATLFCHLCPPIAVLGYSRLTHTQAGPTAWYFWSSSRYIAGDGVTDFYECFPAEGSV